MACEKLSPIAVDRQGGGLFSRRRTQTHGKVDKSRGQTSLCRRAMMAVENATQTTNVPQLFTTIQACYFSQRSCSSNIDFVCSVAKKRTAFALQNNKNTEKKPAHCRSSNFCLLICVMAKQYRPRLYRTGCTFSAGCCSLV